MIQIKKYISREEALEQIMEKDKDYTLIRHDFKAGEIIKSHKHPVDEWVIFDSGGCEISLGLESELIGADNNLAVSIYLPRNQKHGLKCLTNISYWVLRKTR